MKVHTLVILWTGPASSCWKGTVTWLNTSFINVSLRKSRCWCQTSCSTDSVLVKVIVFAEMLLCWICVSEREQFCPRLFWCVLCCVEQRGSRWPTPLIFVHLYFSGLSWSPLYCAAWNHGNQQEQSKRNKTPPSLL